MAMALQMFKEKKRRLLAGIDLQDRFSQISFVYTDREEPVTVSGIVGSEQFNVPTVLAKRLEVNQWFYGKDALKYASDGETVLIKDLLSLCLKEETVDIAGQSFDPVELLALFIRRLLALLNNVTEGDKPYSLMITVERLDKTTINVLHKLAGRLSREADRIFFQSHMESFYDYMLYQPFELWNGQVAVFEYSDRDMRTYRLTWNKNTTPVVAYIQEQEYPDMPYEILPEETYAREQLAGRMDRRMGEIAEEVLGKERVASCFLIGDGFLGDWCRESLKILCQDRRVFQGNNLYSKGACLSLLRKLCPKPQFEKYIFLGKDKVKANIGMFGGEKEKEEYYPILDAGVNWFDANKEWELLLEDSAELHFLITPLNKGERQDVILKLEGIPARPEGFSRVRVGLLFDASNRCTIRVKDLGFGEYFKSSGLEWKDRLTWEE